VTESAPRIMPAAGGGGSGFFPPGTDADTARRIRSRIASPEQLERLVEACAGQFEDRNATMIVTAYGLCCRASEVCGLRWGGIAWGQTVTFWRPKQRRDWSVNPPRRTWDALRRWQMRRGVVNPQGHVFVSRTGRALRPEQFSRIVTRAAIRAGLPENLRGAHLLRHSRCAHLLRAGVELAVVQQIAGHKSPAVTAHYVAAEALAMAERASGSVDF